MLTELERKLDFVILPSKKKNTVADDFLRTYYRDAKHILVKFGDLNLKIKITVTDRFPIGVLIKIQKWRNWKLISISVFSTLILPLGENLFEQELNVFVPSVK